MKQIATIVALCAATSWASGPSMWWSVLQDGPTPSDIVFNSTGFGTNMHWSAPYVVAPTLTDAQITWTSPVGTTNSKTPASTFFTNAGQYKITTAFWPKVTRLSFYAGSGRSYLSNIVNEVGAFTKLSGLTSMANMFDQQTNYFGSPASWAFASQPITDINSAWSLGSSLTGGFPNVSALVNVTNLSSTWYNCPKLSGAIPGISNLTKVVNLSFTWFGCVGATGAFPVISTLTNLTHINYAFFNCTKLTGNVDTIFGDYSGLTKLFLSANAFYGCGGLTGSASNFIAAQKASGFSVGTANTNSSYRTFYGCTGLTDYATMPAAWK